MKPLIISMALALPLSFKAQSFKATLNEDNTISVEEIALPENFDFRDDEFEQLPGFPIGTVASPNFKNFRNVTLADLNNDGIEEILLATNNKIFAFTSEGLLWEKDLSGTAIYPPSVADINQDGQPEIAQVTGGIPNAGRIYVLSSAGEDLAGWPVNLDDHWILSAPALSDLDGDNNMEIVIAERDPPAGNIHIFKLDGSSFSNSWPVSLDGTPAFTPSIGDVDNDGEKDIVIYSTETRYIFGLDGQIKTSFPITTAPGQKYSYQSPILVDLDEDNTLEIVGATHGDIENADPQFYIMNADGSDRMGWPIDVPEDNWTFSAPTVVEIDGEFQIFMSRPISVTPKDMLFGWDSDGNLLPGFPIEKPGGLEGIIAIADVDNDDAYELVFGSNLLLNDQGFIHAYEMDGSGEVEGFPIRPRGWTFLNGAALGDVDNDGMMDLSALTYTQNFGADIDSTFLNVFNLEVPYSSEKVLWSTYKGSNTRTGLIGEVLILDAPEALIQHETPIDVSPNPAKDFVQISSAIQQIGQYDLMLLDETGKVLKNIFSGKLHPGKQEWQVSVNNLPNGMYWINIKRNRILSGVAKLILIK